MSTAVRIDAEATEAFVGRLFNAALESLDLLNVYIGDRLGLYRELRSASATSPELAERAGVNERYAREWLEQQAVTGILEVDDPSAPERARRYTLAPERAEALTDPDSMFSVAPVARAIVACARSLPGVVEAFRTGGGVAWTDIPEATELQADFNRPWLRAALGTTYLPSIADVHARLIAEPPARVLDVACGAGWSSIAIANAYPNVTVDGFDLDEAAIAMAREAAADANLNGRVTFEVRDGSQLPAEPSYDLALVIESLHDMSRPVEVLSSIRGTLAPGGCLIVADEKVAETFTAPGEEIERMMYGFSVVCCLPAGMAEQPSAGTGTVMRPSTLRRYAIEAGFTAVEVFEQIEHPTLRFYRLDP